MTSDEVVQGVKLGPAAGKRRLAEAKVPAVKTVHVALLHDSETTPAVQRFTVIGATLGTIGCGLVWLPLAPLFLAGVAFGYARYVYTQAIRCTVCLAVFRSPAAFNAHTCDPIPSRRRKRVT